MGLFDKLATLFNTSIGEVAPPVEQKDKKSRASRKKSTKIEIPTEDSSLSPKDLATQNGEPYVAIIKMDLDPNDVNNGAFELDWNDKFIVNLIKSGYKIKKEDTDQDLVDRWFQTVCRNIALEVYEQQQADPDKRNDVRIISTKNIGGGRTEVS